MTTLSTGRAFPTRAATRAYSAAFAGEFLILAGAFQRAWWWAAIGAGAIVLAAMYMLRAISGVLHQDVGPAVNEHATDLRLGELAIVVPLLLCLIGLSAWPDLISGRAAPNGNAGSIRHALGDRTKGTIKVVLEPRSGWTLYGP